MANRLFKMRQFRSDANVIGEDPGADPSQKLSSIAFGTGSSVAFDKSDQCFIADKVNHVIYRMKQGQSANVVAGSYGVSGDAIGEGSVARFNAPTAICVDNKGVIYIVDSGNDTIKRMDENGKVTGFAPLTTGTIAGGISVDSKGDVYIVDAI
ncbi:MAG: hypothetical protein AABY32_06520 [Nanoarchaeota archaeon]